MTDEPDDMQLKAEIDRIAGRIDNIIQTVQEYYPLSDHPEKPPESES